MLLMNKIVEYVEKHPWIIYLIAIVLIFPAFLINLGLMPLRFDGAFRGLVAFEMVLQDQYIAPTINGIFYYNKPPLFNWFIVLIYKLTGIYNEYTIRIPVILSLFFIAITIYLFLRKRYNSKFAINNALIFLTGGCIFFGYSSVGLVDFTFAWFLILAYYSIYHYFQKQNYLLLFVTSYLFVSAAYMVKGLPAIAFQGITLLVFFVYSKKFKKLFSWQHLTGILTLLIPLATYYYFYFKINPGSYNQVFFRIFDESLIKAVPLLDGASQTIGPSEKSFWTYIPFFLRHIVLFPLQTLYNMFPWVLLVIFVFRKDFMKIINQADPFLKYAFWIMLFNIIIYWLSPGTDHTKIKYYTFLFPLIYFIIYWFYDRYHKIELHKTRILNYIFYGFSILISLSPLAAPFYIETADIPGIISISVILFLLLSFFTIILFKTRSLKIQSLFIIVIIARIGFNLIMQPVHVESLKEVKFKADAIEAGKIIGDEKVSLCTYINENVTFYITREIQKVLPLEKPDQYQKDHFYIFDQNQMAAFKADTVKNKVYHKFACENKDKDLFLVKFD